MKEIKRYSAEWTLIEINKIINNPIDIYSDEIKKKFKDSSLTSDEVEDCCMYEQRGKIKALLDLYF